MWAQLQEPHQEQPETKWLTQRGVAPGLSCPIEKGKALSPTLDGRAGRVWPHGHRDQCSPQCAKQKTEGPGELKGVFFIDMTIYSFSCISMHFNSTPSSNAAAHDGWQEGWSSELCGPLPDTDCVDRRPGPRWLCLSSPHGTQRNTLYEDSQETGPGFSQSVQGLLYKFI